MFLIGGEKHSHREGLYQCKRCRKGFSVTVGTPLERLRVPLSTWVRAAHAFSYEAPRKMRRRDKDSKPHLLEMQHEIGVSYRTVLRMRDIIKQVAGKYRGLKHVFGAWPRSFMGHKRAKHEKTIKGLWSACCVGTGARLHTGSIEPHGAIAEAASGHPEGNAT